LYQIKKSNILDVALFNLRHLTYFRSVELSFKICSEQDLEKLSEISKETFTTAYEKRNNPIDFKNYINSAFSFSTLKEQLRHKNAHFFFIYLQLELVGYFKLNEYDAQSELQENDGIELERIYIKEKFQGNKYGAKTMAQIIEIAYKKEKRYIWLGVWERNLDAIRFYKSHGFIKFDQHPFYIGKDKQIDWLMRKEL
jgi:ribosomal protein S18 acetylase RimI-like enzyme